MWIKYFWSIRGHFCSKIPPRKVECAYVFSESGFLDKITNRWQPDAKTSDIFLLQWRIFCSMIHFSMVLQPDLFSMKVLSGSIQHVTAPILRHLATSASGWVLMACTTSATSVNLITQWNKSHIATTVEDSLMVKSESWLWTPSYPGVTTITRSLLPLADNLAWRRLWLDKVLVRDSCKTSKTKQWRITLYKRTSLLQQKI